MPGEPKALRIGLAALALLPGGWMLFDGSRALIVGDYVTPSSGEYAGQLGPWAPLVAAAGIPPRSVGMKVTFVALGIVWLVAAFGFATRRRWGDRLLLGAAVATLWYLPVGTLVAFIELVGLGVSRRRREPLPRPAS